MFPYTSLARSWYSQPRRRQRLRPFQLLPCCPKAQGSSFYGTRQRYRKCPLYRRKRLEVHRSIPLRAQSLLRWQNTDRATSLVRHSGYLIRTRPVSKRRGYLPRLSCIPQRPQQNRLTTPQKRQARNLSSCTQTTI